MAQRSFPSRRQPGGRRLTSASSNALAAAMLATFAGPGVTEAAAQAGRVRANEERITRRIENIEPQSGPAGTMVRVWSGLMPAITPVRIGVGGTRMGFEALVELLTTDRGQFDTLVAVPAWTRWDRNHRFIIFDFYFNPIALSAPFIVTDDEGLMRRQGTVLTEGDGCALMQDTDGERWTLVGEVGGLEANTRVQVDGTFDGETDCGEHLAIGVVRVQALPQGP